MFIAQEKKTKYSCTLKIVFPSTPDCPKGLKPSLLTQKRAERE
jgi:hypothetical protein